MQSTLRKRFLIISWVMLVMLLAAICGGIGTYMYQSAVDDTKAALREAVEQQSLDNESIGMLGIRLDRNGSVVESEQSHLSLSEETIVQLAGSIEMTGEQSIGETEAEGMRYRYLSVLGRGGAWAAFAECSQEQALEKSLWRNGIIFMLIGMLLLIPVCILLTRWVSKPIETAWEKQNDFVSDATHELKTPLTVIATNTEAVLANPEAPIESQERWLGSIQDETSRMAGLVGDLLFLAKIDAGEIKLDPEELNISDLLEGMCMERETDIFEAGRQFDYELTPDLHYYGDRRRIEQMMNALLDNAVKYTPEGGSIRLVVNRDRRQRVRVVLSNSGNPLAEEELGKIFDRFYRVDPSRARDTGGYGLGLCVTRSIAELHGGTVTAECRNDINVFTVIFGDIGNTDGKK